MMPRKSSMFDHMAAMQYIHERSVVWIPRDAARAIPKPVALEFVRWEMGREKGREIKNIHKAQTHQSANVELGPKRDPNFPDNEERNEGEDEVRHDGICCFN
jgi:hypothetical protein